MTEPLFTVALIADTHINPIDGESGSPWRSNALANARARWAVAALNADMPEVVFHLGDMVHPLPAQASYAQAAERFRTIFGALNAPLHCLPGNHDIGDKPGDWMPAHPMTADAISIYRRTFGDLWRIVDHGPCRFILHCNPLLGSCLPEDEAQWEWLEAQLSAAGDRRIFFLTHYPLFLTSETEPEHYDNLAPPARERLRRLLVEHGVEAAFAAHVHNIFHTPLDGDDTAPLQHVLPCVSAIRLDYSHLFSSPPGPRQEHGRNDAQKLGYYLLDVLPEGYRIRLRRTEGCALPVQQSCFDPGRLVSYCEDLSDRPLGADMRHDWARPVAIPYSGVVDEFRRKYVRNDYLLTALQEAGIRDIRIPIDDLLDADTSRRMQDFRRLGHRFQIFTIDPPNPDAARLLRETKGIAALEVIARPGRLRDQLSAWRDALGDAEAPILASRLWSSADVATEATRFSHAIGHGFFPEDVELLAEVDDFADGVVVRVAPDTEPRAALETIAESFAGRIVLYISLASNSPAEAADDDTWLSARVLAAIGAIGVYPERVSVMLDTLGDHDRGYYPRNGLYDAQFNPRPIAIRLARENLTKASQLHQACRTVGFGKYESH